MAGIVQIRFGECIFTTAYKGLWMASMKSHVIDPGLSETIV
jgi:hypothetical protein